MGILDRIRKIEERRAQVAERFADRKTLGSLEGSVRVIQLCAIADRLDPKTAHGRRARRVADLMQIALERYCCEFGDLPTDRPLRAAASSTSTAPAFDLNFELERQAQRNEQIQFDQLLAQQHHH